MGKGYSEGIIQKLKTLPRHHGTLDAPVRLLLEILP